MESTRPIYCPPWANCSIIGIAGSSASGKTTLARELVKSIGLPWVDIMYLDSFYRSLTPEQQAMAFRNEYDFDTPSAIDFDVLVDVLQAIKRGERAQVPIYSFEHHQRMPGTVTVYAPRILILEGIFALHDPRVREMMDIMIFTDADADTCLARRISRDVRERGRDLDGIISQWFRFVKPNYIRYVEPQKDICDVILRHGVQNKAGMEMVKNQLHSILRQKTKQHLADLRSLNTIDDISNPTLGDGAGLVYFDAAQPALHRRESYGSQNLMLLQHAAALASASLRDTTDGGSPAVDGTGAVVLRTAAVQPRGAPTNVFPTDKIGHLDIFLNEKTREPELHSHAIPPSFAGHDVVLVCGGAADDAHAAAAPDLGATLMAVKVLTDHGIPEAQIIVAAMHLPRNTAAVVQRVYPQVRVATRQAV